MVTFRELLAAPQTHLKELFCVLEEALALDHATAVSELIRRGWAVRPGDGGAAVQARAKNCLAVFLDSGWDLNVTLGHTTPTALVYAVADREMAFWLLERGADLNKSDYLDITPLSIAVETAAPDLLQELLDHSGDVTRGEVLQYALDRKTDVVTVLGMLLDNGPPLDAVMYESHHGSLQLNFFFERHTPLCKAAAIGNAEALQLLLERGADPSVQNSKGRTPLQCAEKAGHKEIAEVLEQWKPGKNVGNHLPKTPLLIQRHEVWVKTENVSTGPGGWPLVTVGDTFFAAFDARDPRAPRPCAANVAGAGYEQRKEPSGDRSGPVPGARDAEVGGDNRVARWVADLSPSSGPPASSNDVEVEPEHAKEILPPEDPAHSPWCFGWLERWKRGIGGLASRWGRRHDDFID